MRTLWAIAIVMLGMAAPAQAADCTDMFDVPWYSWTQFFSLTSFGSVGFSRDGGGHVYVPRPGTPCVSMARYGRDLRIVFNHRGAADAETGYVSFKLYGFSGTVVSRTRFLERKGAWQRASAGMKDPWKTLQPSRPSPALISDYEAFYKGGDDLTEAAFDQKFGPLHGTPKGSDEDSWNDLTAMQPDTGLVDLSKVSYLAHNLQRVEVSPGTTSPGTPPDYITGRFEYDTLVLHAFTPMAGGKSSTLVFKFTN